jgi:hypothetical protein
MAQRSAHHLRSDVAFVRADAFAMPFASQYFDAAFSQGLFEHFSDKNIYRLAAEQLRVARHVYISVPSQFYPHVWRIGPGLIGNERLKGLAFWKSRLRGFNVDLATYYSDFKMITFAGKTLPWPAQALLRLTAA